MSKVIYESSFPEYPTDQEIAEWLKTHPAAPEQCSEEEVRVEEGDPLYEIDFDARTASRKKVRIHRVRVTRLKQGWEVWRQREGGYRLCMVEEDYFSIEKRPEIISEETLEISDIHYYWKADRRVKLASYTESEDGYRKVSDYVVYKQYRVEFTDGTCTLYTKEVRE